MFLSILFCLGLIFSTLAMAETPAIHALGSALLGAQPRPHYDDKHDAKRISEAEYLKFVDELVKARAQFENKTNENYYYTVRRGDSLKVLEKEYPIEMQFDVECVASIDGPNNKNYRRNFGRGKISLNNGIWSFKDLGEQVGENVRFYFGKGRPSKGFTDYSSLPGKRLSFEEYYSQHGLSPHSYRTWGRKKGEIGSVGTNDVQKADHLVAEDYGYIDDKKRILSELHVFPISSDYKDFGFMIRVFDNPWKNQNVLPKDGALFLFCK